MSKNIGIIAFDSNRLIGSIDGKLPWGPIKEDFTHFKAKTLNKKLLMGRLTYESLPKPYLNFRDIYVLTTDINRYGWQQNYVNNDKLRYSVNLISSISEINCAPEEELYICGGRQLYLKYITENLMDEWWITYIKGQFIGSVSCPEVFEENFLKNEITFENEQIKIVHFSERKPVENLNKEPVIPVNIDDEGPNITTP
jgi:dihydrofolate reductase